jgi:hypothetical protein
LSKELKHVTGNITVIKKTATESEIIIGTQRGVYIALLGKGLGLKEIEIQRFNKEMSLKKTFVVDEMMSMRNPGMSENADITTNGARPSDIEGMS